MAENVKPIIVKDGNLQEFANDNLNLEGLPTSDAGLVSGDLWVDPAADHAIKVVP